MDSDIGVAPESQAPPDKARETGHLRQSEGASKSLSSIFPRIDGHDPTRSEIVRALAGP